SVGAATCAATATGLAGLRFGGWAVGAALVLLLGAVAGLRRLAARLAARRGGGALAPLEEPPPGRAAAVATAVLTAAAAAAVLVLFRRGVGTLATPTQEHDAITHTLVVAHVLRSGEAAPWRAQALDVVTGTPALYYPDGLHQWAALTAQVAGLWGASPVAALNATSVLALALVQPLGLVALAARALPRGWLPAGAVAAVASALAYQPLQAMHHDSGALANAAALAVAPGAIALVLPPRGPGARSAAAVAPLAPVLALGCAGAVTVHPSAALTVAGGALGAVVLGALATRRTALTRWWVAALAVAAVLVAALVGTALLRAAQSGGGSSARFVRDIPPQPLPEALHRVLTLPLQGGVDPAAATEQWWLAVPVLLGALLAGRAGAAVALTWAVWSAIAVAYLVDAHPPVLGGLLDLVWDSAWNSYYRVVAHGGPWAWLLAGVAVVRSAGWLARALGGRGAPVAAGALGLVLLAGAAAESGPTEVRALRERYADPAYQRVDADDEAAARYLAGVVRPGERVLNSGNDGSTYAYVLHGVPVMATTAVPTPPVPDLRLLLSRFRDLGTDPAVAELVRRERVAWVVVDADAPVLPLRPDDALFFGVPQYSVPPGLVDLDAVAGLERVFTSGTVGVWRVDAAAAVPGGPA
ncbi:hypothetical protein GTQ99_21665, partial [Kineococcus sp. T13]|uniref:DUF6541 family protein n=1 Tax=Kineococcus vitellinus TaxID=2696565 RepID=UPI001412FC85